MLHFGLSRGVLLTCALTVISSFTAAQADNTITVDLSTPGITVSPLLYGIFFEDINRSGDGGLYSQMLINPSFEDFNLPLGWSVSDAKAVKISVDQSQPLNNKNPSALKIEWQDKGSVINQGFKGANMSSKDPVVLSTPENPNGWKDSQKFLDAFARGQASTDNGLFVEAGKSYTGSFYARGSLPGPLVVSLVRKEGTELARQEIPALTADWKKYDYTLSASADEVDARFLISSDHPGTVWVDMVTLYPVDTFNQRPQGLSAPLMKMLVEMHPAFVRFPGGSYAEGSNLKNAFRWKETIGDIAQRSGQWNIWGYRSTDWLGYHELLQMCEDLKAEPLFVINCGMAERGFVDLKDLDPWVQDALDSIEYANGPATSPWGAKRAAAGHPAPFNLKLFEIGNENGMSYGWGGGNPRQYADRYTPFYQKLKATYPELQTIATAPIQKAPINAPVDRVDEHYYPAPKWFEEHASMYDGYDRNGPKIYVGEYASKNGVGKGNLEAALGEAAFMTGMERNSDLVLMSSYAPLFVNPMWQAWNPNAIVFNTKQAYGTPSYYNQCLFAQNRADVIAPMQIQEDQLDAKNNLKALYGVAGKKNDTGEIILKVVNTQGSPRETKISLNGATAANYNALVTTLTSAKPGDENSFAEPKKIAPAQQTLTALASSFSYTFPPYSITVLRLQSKQP